jgi:hypothetical protein
MMLYIKGSLLSSKIADIFLLRELQRLRLVSLKKGGDVHGSCGERTIF